MAPNKIYLAWEYPEIDTLPPGVTAKQVFGKDACYIRKDALLEWANEQYKHLDGTTIKNPDSPYWGQMVAFQQLIDKLNSL